MASTKGLTLDLEAGTALSSLANFSHLPYGVQASIITMACWLPSTRSTPEAKERSVVLLDVETTTSLARVSKLFHDVAVKTLYANLRITRPTTLRLLVAALLDRPELGRLIKSLHIGPENALPRDWLPIYDGRLVLSMSAPTDEGRYPWWITPPHPIYFTGLDTEGRVGGVTAIRDAIASAYNTLNVDLYQVNRSQYGLMIPAYDWYRRVFEVFAAIELYVMELPLYEVDRQTGFDYSTNVRYPRLILKDTPSRPPWPGQPVTPSHRESGPALTLFCKELRARLAAPYTNTDRFDHPLLFARSNVAWEAEGPEGDLRSGGDRIRWSVEDADQPASSAEALRDPAALSHATLGTILGLARSLLERSPLLRNLSLTGFLERAICGTRTVGELKELRTCTLGPPPACWHWVPALRLDSEALKNVQKLRICGHAMSKEQAATLVSGALPRLEVFEWSYNKELVEEEDGSVTCLEIINVLVGRDFDVGQDEMSSGAPKGGKDPDDLFIEAHLHPRQVAKIFAQAPDLATRQAWKEGTTPPAEAKCRRRLRLVASRAYEEGGSSGICREQVDETYEEGQEWFAKVGVRAGVGC